MRFPRLARAVVIFVLGVAACNVDDELMQGVDSAVPMDARPAAPPTPASTDHCDYVQIPPTARSGSPVEAGDLEAGVAEGRIMMPLGSSLAAYTGRAESLGADGFADERRPELSGVFSSSAGLETAPRIRVLALRAGNETTVLIKADIASAYQGLLFDIEANLGEAYAGKVIVATSHSHSSYGNYSGHTGLVAGFGVWRATVYERLVTQMTALAQEAIGALQPARIGFAYNGAFDPENRVTRDRRSANDALPGGQVKDHHLYVIRVDTESGEPLALIPVFGMHGTTHSAGNFFLSGDSVAGIERVLEEEFDRAVLVMHLQGAGGDVSPVGIRATDCDGVEACFDFARAESIGHFARAEILEAWRSAGDEMQARLEIESVTSVIPLGPDWRNFTIRDGALRYAPWDTQRRADGVVFDSFGEIVSPIDEFNAPYGAALCDEYRPAFPNAALPGLQGFDGPYGGCMRIEEVDTVFEALLDVDFEAPPLCESTQTVVSALRLGDHMIVTLPGEPVTLLSDHLRTLSPFDSEHTIIVGYSQDHGGYLMTPEDWLEGGYEPTIGFWGPLEGEYVAEQAARVMALAVTPEREDATVNLAMRVATPMRDDGLVADPPRRQGIVPDTMPEYLLTRRMHMPSRPQPQGIRRLDSAYFTWFGKDPLIDAPVVLVEREEVDGFQPLHRRSGRLVQDGEMILSWTPNPLADGAPERVHYWTIEWQAATQLGAPGMDSLQARIGLPLGRYRFRVMGWGYEIVSDPFEVSAANLVIETEGAADALTYRVGVSAASGYRLLDLEVPSNGFVPLRSVDLNIVRDGEVIESVSTDASGILVLPREVERPFEVHDRFGNIGRVE